MQPAFGGLHNAVGLTIDAGLKAYVDFIFGLPHESREDREATFSMVQKLIEMWARIHTHTFMPLPQTGFANEHFQRLDNEFKQRIDNLPQGSVFGEWREQETMCSNYYTTSHPPQNSCAL